MTPSVPPPRDRMPGAYCGPRCPHCRAEAGPSCADTARATKRLRHAERDALRRHVADVLGAEPHDPLLDPFDCQHGCSGGRYGCSERCNFTCHEEDDADD